MGAEPEALHASIPADEARPRAVSEMSLSDLPPLTTASRRLRAYFWPQRHGLLLAMAAFVLAAATEPLIPMLLRVVLDEGFVAQPSFPLWMVPVVLIGLFVARGLLSFVGIYLLNRSTSRAVLALRRVKHASCMFMFTLRLTLFPRRASAAGLKNVVLASFA